MKPMTPNALFALVGSKMQVARWTGLSPSAMTVWTRLDRVPAEYCKKIEIGSKGRITRHLLRPDLWEDPPAKTPRRQRRKTA